MPGVFANNTSTITNERTTVLDSDITVVVGTEDFMHINGTRLASHTSCDRRAIAMGLEQSAIAQLQL
jgi:hypothetical protein